MSVIIGQANNNASTLLSHEDYLKLKEHVISVHLRRLPRHLAEKEADKYMDTFVPQTVETMIKQAVDNTYTREQLNYRPPKKRKPSGV